ncbi:aldehyde dehydrogenase family protein [Temperatibacter marinus]|uniref:Aldehyde dehydrogenase family protein n=1 Tax=Temperatibacter marinus TaxID=1456591 RepID=A0AA52EEZ1_9PROT|nr:aldehyde dehydrogenase family protein [Temperatibacter marinus]WND03495.1 aldehyde dehydrogenase family protein [Temperatibacter marinus]
MSSPFPVRNPRTGVYDYRITPTPASEISLISSTMRVHQETWLQIGLGKRIAILQQFAESLIDHKETVLKALEQDTGRSLISSVEIDGIKGAVDRWAAIACAHKNEIGVSSSMPHISYEVTYNPYPLVGVISPWNFPLTLSFIDALPALIAGCAVLIKPSEITPRFAEPLRKILTTIPHLKDVLVLVDGDGETGAAVVDQVDTICFTGSVKTGRIVGEQAARNFIPSFLELGGKDPAIVLKSADIDHASTALLRASILNNGQACQSIERIYVDEAIYADFMEALIHKAQQVTLNSDDIHKGILGPIIFEKQAQILQDQIDDAREKGAVIHTGGHVENHGGSWLKPTVITDLTPDMLVLTEETFGPLLPVIPFNTVDEAISRANDSDYGLSACVFAATAEEAIEVGRHLEAGGISINEASLTALMHEAEKNSFKLSGMGASRMGHSGYLRFFRRQSLMINNGKALPIHAFDENYISN